MSGACAGTVNYRAHARACVCAHVFVRVLPVCFSAATLAVAFGEMCASLEDQLGFQSVCVSWCVRARTLAHVHVRSIGPILLLQSETRCLDRPDKLARSPQSATFPPISSLAPSCLVPSLPHSLPPFLPHSLCELRTAGQGDSDEVHISVNQNVD